MLITGILKYSGLRQGVGYLQLECNNTDVKELQHKVENAYNIKLKVKKPHVSIVRDEAIPFPKFWYKYKEPISIEVLDDQISTDGRFYWVDVKCFYSELIREELGLSKKPKLPLHLTLGNN